MPLSGGVPAEYAARTVCTPHTRRYKIRVTGNPDVDSLQRKLRGRLYSKCEVKKAIYPHAWPFGCQYSHTIFNTKRVLRLGGNSPTYTIRLDYGFGFERCEMYKGWNDGWNVIVNDVNYSSKARGKKTCDLPKCLLLAEHKLGIGAFNAEVDSDGKVQSLCKPNHNHGHCKFNTECRYDHDLVDSTRLECLVGCADGGALTNRNYLSIECLVQGGHAPTWKITIKTDAFSTCDPVSKPIEKTYEGKDLLKVVRYMERVIGLKK